MSDPVLGMRRTVGRHEWVADEDSWILRLVAAQPGCWCRDCEDFRRAERLKEQRSKR